MATSSLSWRQFEQLFLGDRALSPSYEEVFNDPPRIAPIPWHLIPLQVKLAIVASGLVIWLAALGFLIAAAGK